MNSVIDGVIGTFVVVEYSTFEEDREIRNFACGFLERNDEKVVSLITKTTPKDYDIIQVTHIPAESICGITRL